MTKEEAIEMIENDKRIHHDFLSGKYRQALTMAIEALERTSNASNAHPTHECVEPTHECVEPVGKSDTLDEDMISRCELFNKLAVIPAPPEANEYKAEVYKVINEM